MRRGSPVEADGGRGGGRGGAAGGEEHEGLRRRGLYTLCFPDVSINKKNSLLDILSIL